MLNNTLKMITLCLFPLLLTACGGGGGGSSSADINVTDSSNTSIDNAEITTTEAIESVQTLSLEMDDLVATEDFSFTSKQKVQVFLELTDLQQERAYVSIYSNYMLLDSGRFYPDSSSRVISGALDAGTFSESFTAVKQQSEYLIEIWFYDGSEPQQEVITLTNNELIWM